MAKTLITGVTLIVASAGVTLAQDVEKGATVFKKCAICHRIGPGATNYAMRPVEGVVSLTLVLIALFIVEGIFQIAVRGS